MTNNEVVRPERRDAVPSATLYVDGQPASWTAYFQVALEELAARLKGFAKGLHE